MSAQANAAPVIIKKKKVIAGGGHHGGAWKVAYADFVTAMMAFFMLMWLLNATTEQQRKGIADYFSPTIPINRVSGGGNGAFGGESIFSEMTLPKNGTGATAPHSSMEDQARGASGTSEGEKNAEQEAFEAVEAMLMGRGGETMVMENALKHIVTRITDEGLVIELFELEDVPLFKAEDDEPAQLLRDLAAVIAELAKTVTNRIAIGGHVRSDPVVLAQSVVWERSANRADQMRHLLEEVSIDAKRVQRVTGHADRSLAVRDPMARRNNRIEVILLRDTKRN
ncbi:chemotaxis protein MotB [Sulfitobacter mediterraneus]|jgi:chemotaxis protein MotB|uniref:flagellar motor protein MotB n=1 Tax=Sulfitobacter mediterraneus TaxID=83219 RepID=UPI001932D507|nr:flagellar motor protein MotB [Sulfitobacter mediterraneus]MBM1308800.1 chemotaxis protein MotB [Sulfitobacter mediterraneus]MBM1312685.1 chemotaxis protein MotB [Sulfitobacter mediterraneus]MBM1321067.1 chemotaxis protein MotB [Sulfitobacter mediterraneus]MBM1324954.1 chemotaxis protein MotB [Sulfitobacter mediterraneus]MBM1396301.1 chemotaxis protein MotB [Sulfitobacter mediterraneus]